jgi:murein peptide amidase A
VIGAIHGNERAGIAIVQRLEHDTASRDVSLWVLPDLNPDGAHANTRGNAHGVDLNRNFAWRWRPRTAPGTTFYAGPGPLSEPESRFARLLISRLRPDITIWFHQSETAVDSSGGSTAIEARFARRVALPLRRLIRYPGSATTWQTHRFPKSTAFVVELPPGTLSANAARAYARAVLALAAG